MCELAVPSSRAHLQNQGSSTSPGLPREILVWQAEVRGWRAPKLEMLKLKLTGLVVKIFNRTSTNSNLKSVKNHGPGSEVEDGQGLIETR